MLLWFRRQPRRLPAVHHMKAGALVTSSLSKLPPIWDEGGGKGKVYLQYDCFSILYYWESHFNTSSWTQLTFFVKVTTSGLQEHWGNPFERSTNCITAGLPVILVANAKHFTFYNHLNIPTTIISITYRNWANIMLTVAFVLTIAHILFGSSSYQLRVV